LANPKPGEVFYDLGSGAGKAAMIAGLAFDFSKVRGIEKLDDLHATSTALLKKLPQLPEFQQLLPNKHINIQFIHNDFLKEDISDADLVFANATCFRADLWNNLITKLLSLKKGARIIVASQSLDAIGGFELKYSDLHLMSWGLSTISIYERI
jgi:predicted RNA methylase